MVLKSTFTFVVVATLAIFASAPQAEAHSYADCIDFKFKNTKTRQWGDGTCKGFARRFPVGKIFGSLDSNWPSRHFLQNRNSPNTDVPCSNRGINGDETLANPVSKAYNGQYGKMTVTTVGDTLCVRWPAKNHARPEHPNHPVQINLSKVKNGKDITQQELLKNTIANLPYKNCDFSGSDDDHRPCGGCFKVPARAPGTYLMQWRWMLNQDEWYTSCADVYIGPKAK